jgi:nitrate reductase molybdenum cofactor assembly chaperone NarJ/NarW
VRRHPLTQPERGLLFASAALLLRYPDEQLVERLPLLRRVTDRLPSSTAAPLDGFLDFLAASPLIDLQAGYVATFDLKRRNCLYLTYYLNGDTRRRGLALWRFQDAYRSRGLTVDAGELPDFLPVVLELAASGPEDLALALLSEHRQGLEVLERSLREATSPYAAVVDVLTAALPDPSPAVLAAAATLAADGPPVEQVGLEPFFAVETLGVRS